MKIMLVDDNAEIRRLLKTALARHAAEFVECADGTEAVAAFGLHHPDWTIMDVAMKPMDGLEATRQITTRHTGSRILMLTQFDTPPMRAAARQAGAVGFLSKDRLGEIAELLDQATGDGSQPVAPEPR